MGKVDLVRFELADALAQTAAREWFDIVARSDNHSAAFSGGRISENFFAAIASESIRARLSLSNVHFLWADERCVPAEHPDSNYRTMHAKLLTPLKVPDAQVHRIKGELGPVAAAREASAEFARVAPSGLDFVFLGMGEDGHIASIFPGDPIQESPGVYYRPVLHAPKPPRERVTLAMHAMVSARNVWVLVSGAGKEEALGKSLREAGTPLGWLLQRRNFTRIFTNVLPK